MNTTAAIFFLILGQADGFANMGHSTTEAGGLALIPAHYTSLADCENAGEAARANNNGLSFLSYTCVPASVNVGEIPAALRTRPNGNYVTVTSASLSGHGPKVPTTAPAVKCLEVCAMEVGQ